MKPKYHIDRMEEALGNIIESRKISRDEDDCNPLIFVNTKHPIVV